MSVRTLEPRRVPAVNPSRRDGRRPATDMGSPLAERNGQGAADDAELGMMR